MKASLATKEVSINIKFTEDGQTLAFRIPNTGIKKAIICEIGHTKTTGYMYFEPFQTEDECDIRIRLVAPLGASDFPMTIIEPVKIIPAEIKEEIIMPDDGNNSFTPDPKFMGEMPKHELGQPDVLDMKTDEITVANKATVTSLDYTSEVEDTKAPEVGEEEKLAIKR